MGSDAFAIVWDGKELHGLNASGRSPAAWNADRFKGRTDMPDTGWDTVTVPGAVSAWAALSHRFGRLPFADLAAPAIHYARHGFPVSPTIARLWALGAAHLVPARCSAVRPMQAALRLLPPAMAKRSTAGR